MNTWVLEDRFGMDNLHLRQREVPSPGPGELLVRVLAISLNYRDLLMLQGAYNPRQRLPLVPCSDGVGEVVAVGDGVDEARVGERVCPIFSQAWLSGVLPPAALKTTLGGPLDGTLTEYMVVPEAAAVTPPVHLSDAEAACLPCAAVTAWRAVVTEGRVGPGSVVLTLGTGGVSLFALQIARMLGAEVIITSSSDDKLARVTNMGATHTVNYKTEPRWGRRARELAGSGGIDLVVELGGAGTISTSLGAVRTGGTIALIGVLAGVETALPLTRILMHGIRVQGIFVGARSDFIALNEALRQHPDVRPIIDREFAFGDAKAALEHLASGRHMGKVVIRGV